MKYPMRRNKQQLTTEECYEILDRGTEGVLSLVDPNGLPYGVPLNYLYEDEAIYVHCAKEGRKLDCIEKNSNASFCVIDAAEIVPEKFTTYFRSVIASGTIRIVENEEAKLTALRKLGLKYNNDIDACNTEVANAIDRCLILALDIEEVTGKQARELVKGH